MKKGIRIKTCLFVRDVNSGFAMSTEMENVHHAMVTSVKVVFRVLAKNTNIVAIGIVNMMWNGIVKGVVVKQLAIVNGAMKTAALVTNLQELREFMKVSFHGRNKHLLLNHFICGSLKRQA